MNLGAVFALEPVSSLRTCQRPAGGLVNRPGRPSFMATGVV